MKKKIWITIIFSIFLTIGGIVFITNSFKKQNIIEEKKYIVVKVKKGKYNFPLTFKKFTTVKEILLTFDIPAFSQITKIEIGVGKNKRELFLNDQLNYDANIKVIYKK